MERIELDEVVAAYEQGILSQIDFYVGIVRHLNVENVDTLMPLFKDESRGHVVAWATGPSVGLEEPKPTAGVVRRVHEAMRHWLDKHPDYARHAKPGFLSNRA